MVSLDVDICMLIIERLSVKKDNEEHDKHQQVDVTALQHWSPI